MKQYICKEDLLERISLLKEAKLDTFERVVGVISTQPTVTKFDICREFWNKIQFYSNCKSSNHLPVAERLLTEMESEE